MKKFSIQFADNTDQDSQVITDMLTKVSFKEFGIDCITITETIGTWRGVPERSFKIEVTGDYSLKARVVNFALYLKNLFNQQTVLFATEQINAELL